MLSTSMAWCHRTTAGKEIPKLPARASGPTMELTLGFSSPLQPPAPTPPPALPLLRAKGP